MWSAGGGLHADSALFALGGGVLGMALLGLLAARLHSRCLLQLYGAAWLLLTLGLVAFVGGIAVLGVEGLADSAFLSANWHYVREIAPITKEDFLRLLTHHYTKLAMLAALVLVVQFIVLTATCVLRRALLGPRDASYSTSSERAGLMSSDDEDDDGEQMV